MKKIIYTAVSLLFVSMIGLAWHVYNNDAAILADTLKQEDVPNIEYVIKEDEPLNYEQRIEKGQYYFEKGFLSLAATEFSFAAQSHPTEPRAFLELGKSYLELGEYDKSQLALQKVLELQPNQAEALVLLGKIDIKQSDFESAKSYFEKIQKSPEALYYLGILEALIGDKNLARTYIEDAKLQAQSSDLIVKIEEISKAFREFDLFPDTEVVYFQTLLARSLNKVDEYEMAIFTLRNTLKTKIDYRDAWILLGYAYLSLEKYDFALTAFEKAYQLDSQKAETQYFLGLTYAELNKKEEAIAFLKLALNNAFEPQVQVKQKLADLYLKTEQYEQAVKTYEEVLALNDSDVSVFVTLVHIYLDLLNKPKKALEVSFQALKRHEDNAMSYNLVGWVYNESGELDVAEKYLRKAISIDQKLAPAYLNLGKVFEEKGTPASNEIALNLYQRAYNLDKFGDIGNIAAKSYNELITK